MKEKIIAFISRYPILHSLSKKTYWAVLGILAVIAGASMARRRWLGRSREEVAKDLENLNHPHRAFLAKKIAAAGPFESVLEAGCGYGANLYWLAREFPQARLTGIDLDPRSIEQGRRLFVKNNLTNVELAAMKMTELDKIPDKSYDAVFTDAVLLYAGPEIIENVIGNLLRIARKSLFLLEWHSDSARGRGEYWRGCWRRDYRRLLGKYVAADKITAEKIPADVWPDKNWQEAGYLVSVKNIEI
ncbi:MAG: class I SAM-dependent methyltransferase [Candidatus Pacebacteria bacterium]|jgi:SAM-dependent methyltransferase|nr:class I SAM-dependent methyltransferase [Candidatus Paceibacterota bacterium]